MAGEEEEQHIHIAFPFGMQPSKEQIAQMEAAHEEFMTSATRFLRSLDSEQLITFLRINRSAMQSPSVESTLMFWNGLAAGVLDVKHEVCPNCMKKNHGMSDDISSL
jgi:hypothetical protein